MVLPDQSIRSFTISLQFLGEVERAGYETRMIGSQRNIIGSRVAFALLAAYCLLGAATVIVDSTRLLHNPWENTYFESPQTYAAIYAAQTGKLYIPMSQPPYTPQAYAPLYYAANACIASYVHRDVDLFILYSRLMTYVAYLLCGLMVFMIGRAADISPLHSLLAALMMLGQPDFLGWNISPRPDMLFLLAMLVSLYCALRWEDHVWRGYGLAGVFAGIAFLIKQPGIAVAIAICVVLGAQKQFKKAAALAAGALAPVAITFVVLYWRHDPFFQQIMFVGKSFWSIRDAATFVVSNFITPYWIVPLCIGAAGFSQAVTMGNKPKMIASFALVNLLVGLSGLPQVGGYVNYLLPGIAGCALLLPYAILLVRERVRLLASLALVSAALIWTMGAAYTYDRGLSNYFQPPTDAPLTWLRPFRILSDRTTMNVHGREPNLLDPFGAHVLELTGYWNSAPVVDKLNRGEYDLIILTRVTFRHVIPFFRGISYFSPDEVAIMNEKYEVLCSTMESMVLKPRWREVAATPQMFSQLFNSRCGTGFRRVPLHLQLAPDTR